MTKPTSTQRNGDHCRIMSRNLNDRRCHCTPDRVEEHPESHGEPCAHAPMDGLPSPWKVEKKRR